MDCINERGGDSWHLYHGDSCRVITGIPDDSIDFGIHSPPFANLYIYSDSEADMGNCRDTDEFIDHYRFLVQELHRTTVPGRLCAVHCKDLPRYQNRDGAGGLEDFPGRIREVFEDCGWQFHSRVTIWKCPVTEMQRTKNQGLLHKQLCDDSSYSRQGMADYLMVFRKWDGRPASGDFPKPVGVDPLHRFTSYIGTNPPGVGPQWREDAGGEVMLSDSGRAIPNTRRNYSIEVWQRYASPVWFDINQMRVLNTKLAKESDEERHICPLQLDVIERAVHLWTNEGDVVLSPFAGIGSEGVGALNMGRRFIGCELKESYFRVACENLNAVEKSKRQRSLFGGDDE